MKSLSTVASLTFALTLAACGGGSDNGGTDVRAPNTDGGASIKLNSTPQIIEYHGDSTVWGYRSGTTGDRVEEQYQAPTAFAAALPRHHQVINLGRNSTTMCELLDGSGAYAGIEPVQPSWEEHINNSNATVVIINHGINDITRGDRDETNLNSYRRCLNQVVDIAQAADKVVILETPNPIADNRIEEFVATMQDVASEQGVYLIDQYAYLREQYGEDISAIAPDGTHPSEEVYVEKGEYAASRFATFDRP